MSKYSHAQKKVEAAADGALSALERYKIIITTGAGAIAPDDLSAEQAAAVPVELFSPAVHDAAEAERTASNDYSYWRSTLRMFMKNPVAVISMATVLLIVLFTLVQPILPGQMDANKINNNPETGLQIINRRPDGVFWFGTNSIGQDLWARIWSGTRTSLFIGLTVAVLQALIGITMGMLWGYVRKLDFLFTEIYNVLNNIPTTILLILASYIMRPSVRTIIIAMSLTSWIVLARFIRNLVMIIRDQDFNLASRCLGSGLRKVILRNLLPQMVSVIMLRMALSIPDAIGMEVFLTYIGLGVPVETPSLGNLINSGRILMMSPSLRYQLIFPAVVLSIITICFYLIGNAFADAADPKNHQ
ncbi:MAG: ABC transporter permease [Oscillospiraceae bacterium]|jgi:oligopeptide transport system permease protein|nr:ABC transporter permease [Oscillospiraceae bacterium]